MAANTTTQNDPAIETNTHADDKILIDYTIDWNNDHTSPDTNGPIQAMLCPPQKWIDKGIDMPFLICVAASNVPEGKRSQLLSATARMGLPVYFHILPDQPDEGPLSFETIEIQQRKAQGLMEDSPGNMALHYLSAKTSLTSPGIRCTTVPGNPRPRILLTRADREPLSDGQMRVMFSYMLTEFMTLNMPGEGPTRGRVTPEMFITLWNTRGFEEKCPVTLACKTCGKDEEGKMLKCGKCGVSRYCDQACQKADWGYHKKVCVKG